MVEIFTEVVIAPDADDEAIAVFAAKKNLRLLVTGGLPDADGHGRDLHARWPAASWCRAATTRADHRRRPEDRHQAPADDGRGARHAVRLHRRPSTSSPTPSSTPRAARPLGIGAGQMNRRDSARIAALRAGRRDCRPAESLAQGWACASEAFFPFPDGLIQAAEAGATAIIQPGGSMQRRRGDRRRRRARPDHGLHRRAGVPALGNEVPPSRLARPAPLRREQD